MHRGGAERVAATLCSAWAQRGDDVTLVATYSGRGECQYPLADGVRLVYLADLAAGRPRRILGYSARLRALRRLIGEQAPDVVISFLTNVNIMAALATRGSGIPLIISERNDPKGSTDLPAHMKWLCQLLYPLADIITVQTGSIADAMRTLVPGAERIEIIPNPVPETLFDTQPASAPSHGRRRLLAMGRLSPQKQMDHLISVFAELAPAHPDVDLWIWGEGKLRPDLEHQIREAGLEDRIFLPGRTDSPWAEMVRSEMLILTSAYEGFPNVMLEAMALGLPCIAYDCNSGPRDLSEDGKTAQLIPPNNKERLREGITMLLEDAVLRNQLGTAAAESVRRRYRIDTILAQWDHLICTARRNRGLACA